MSVLRTAGIGAFVLLANVASSWAAWPSDPAANVPLTTIPFEHLQPQIASDGAGGAIICWQDFRSGQSWDDIYAQRIGQDGAIDWTLEGAAVCVAPYAQVGPQLVSDGDGGAIIAWKDARSNVSFDIYAQRITSLGSPVWTSDGVAVSLADGNQDEVQLLSDGVGGAYVVWTDYRAGNADIYAQRLSSSGSPLWAANGIPICANVLDQVTPEIEHDGMGGITVVWIDRRDLGITSDDLYAQKISGTGIIQWIVDGVAIAARPGQDRMHHLVADGSNGVIVCWSSPAGAGDIFAQRVSSNGSVLWNSAGVPVCIAAGNQIFPQSISDGSGGAFICWSDNRPSASGIYAQRITATGVVTWLPNGTPVTTAPNSKDRPQLVSDSEGGIIVAWEDSRNVAFEPDIYAQRMDALGTAQWTSDGVAVSIAEDWQWVPMLVSDGTGGAIIVWEDERVGEYDVHVYTQQIGSNGQLGDISTDIGNDGRVPHYSFSTFPNPTSGPAAFRFEMSEASSVVVEVFSVAGQLVFRGNLGRFPAGFHHYAFNGRDADGTPLPSGVYLCRVSAGPHKMLHKLTILR